MSNEIENQIYEIVLDCFHAGSMGRAGKTIHSETVSRWTKAIQALLDKERLRGKLDAAQYISNKLPAEEPTIIASRRTEDEDMIWVKAQTAFADFFGDEIGSYERDLTHQLEALEKEKTDD